MKKKSDTRDSGAVPSSYSFAEHSGDEVLSALRSSRAGLTSAEAAARLARYGANTLGRKRRFVMVRRVITQIRNPVVFILLVSGIITYFIGNLIDSYVIFAALVINLIVTLLQEQKVSRAFDVLSSVDRQHAFVLRDGKKTKIPSEKLVPGDIVFFEAGARVDADIRILEENSVLINESILTGEWAPVHKKEVTLANTRPLAEQVNMAWKGTTVVSGTGYGAVVRTGIRSAMGTIARNLYEEKTKTPLFMQIQQLAQWIMLFVLLSVFIIIWIALFQGIPLDDIIKTSIAVAIAGIPSGLPAAITIVLVVGMQSVLKSGGLVRNMLAAETLGGTTWILTDKTGTLTNGKMSLFEIITMGGRERVTEDTVSPAGRAVVLQAFGATDGRRLRHGERDDEEILGTSVEQALLHACEDVCTVPTDRSDRIFYLPFDTRTRYSASLVRSQGGELRYFVVGAPETVLAGSKTVRRNGGAALMTSRQREELESILRAEGEKGRRVIAIATADGPPSSSGHTDDTEEEEYRRVLEERGREMTFVAFLTLEDRIRDDVPEAISFIRNAHVSISMVTGDNKHTALYIAKQSGIVRDSEPDTVLLGEDIREMSDEELFAKARTVRVFARMLPDQKSRLLRVLLNRGEVVAMTGDGVNDAPALHRASIGIALASGTDVAKEASDLILLKNSFSTITASIVEGKKIIQNLKKIMIYLLSTSFSEAILVAGGLLATATLPILPLQILWANIVEEAFIAFAFAFEKADTDNAKYNPRDPQARNIINTNVRRSIAILSVLIGFFLFAVYIALDSFTALTDMQIQTVMFIAVSVDSIFLALSLKRLDANIFSTNMFSNWWLIIAISISIAILIAAFFIPKIVEVLQLVPIPWWSLSVIPVSALFHITVIETIKTLLFRNEFRPPGEKRIACGTRG